jgi:hypothetical protein
MKHFYLTKKINNIVSTILILLGLKEESVGVTTTTTSSSVIHFDTRNRFGLYSFKAALVFLFFVFGMSNIGNAQVSNYSFAQSSGTYTAITGGTLHGTAVDDANYSFTLPFTFTYRGTGYTVARPTTNGFLVLGGNAPSTTQYTPLSSGSTNIAIAAMARDLNSTVRSEVLGVSPNRVYVCQWTSYRYAVGSTETLNAQVRLYETTNVVQIVYGTITTGNTTIGTGAIQVGLRGTANTDFNNRTTTTDWTASTAGGTNTATCGITSTVKPASGQTYTWTPPLPCVAPTAQPTSLTFGATTGTSISGSFTAATGSPGGYLVVRSTSSSLSSGPVDATIYSAGGALGGGTVVQSGTSLSFTNTGLTGNTQYYYFVYSFNNTGCSGGPKYFTTSPLTSNNITCPDAPTLPTYSGIATDQGTVSWTAAPVGGSAGSITYTFETYTDAARTVAFGAPVTGITETSYNVTGLSPGITYYFKIKSNNGSCDSTYLSTGTFVTTSLPPSISAISPSVLCLAGGQSITLTGANLSTVTSVLFNSASGVVLPGVITASTATTLTVTTPADTVDGIIRVINPAGSADSSVTFTTVGAPTIGVSAAVAICSGTSTTLTATGGATYAWSPATGLSATTGDTVTASPTSTRTYTVTGTSAAGCTATNTVAITVNPTPTAVTLSKVPTIACIGGTTTLTATGGQVGAPGTVTIGTGTTAGAAAASDPTAFNNRFKHYWIQMVFTPAELNAAGISAGNITAVKFTTTTLGDASTVTDLKVRMGTSSSATLSAFQPNGLTLVKTSATYTHAVGVNTLTFDTPYAWDGVSNLLFDLRSTGADATNNARTLYTATTGNTVVSAVTSTTSSSDGFAALSPAPTASTFRLNTTFDATVASNGPISWSPTTDLFTDAAATIA